ncbi:hypothetical protein SERLA73DRAFT_75220 [Serpula lacrymans var. lacrymans S7.3]|uniref:Uncharacterized protein n=1 Tax=Serpula lacrymans var. lacrymans (strain S7.3) TaxID=936435 RepID=F8Q2Z2_SERL3|nr:hypothetical protein SERLA73DRAFT_75220 [Serpula lacrymans var. lacrymans S7.3]
MSNRDRNNWKKYYVVWFVDRDMMMQYHWGLGIGHTYARGEASEGIDRLGVFSTNNFTEYLPSSSAVQTSEIVNYQSDQLDKDNGEDSDVFIEEDVNLEFTLQDCEGEDFGYNQDSDEDSDTDKLLLDLDGTDVVGYNYD